MPNAGRASQIESQKPRLVSVSCSVKLPMSSREQGPLFSVSFSQSRSSTLITCRRQKATHHHLAGGPCTSSSTPTRCPLQGGL